MDNCVDIEVPEVNNQNQNCYEFKDSKCVVVTGLSQNIITYYNLPENPSLDEVLSAVANALQGAKQDINDLQNPV